MFTVLVIDDSAIHRSAVEDLLGGDEYTEYTVTTARTGEEGLGQLVKEPVDLALVDYRLPDTDGVSLTGQIKKLRPDCAVVLWTSEDPSLLNAQALAAGALEVLAKSSGPAGLRRAVEGAQASSPSSGAPSPTRAGEGCREATAGRSPSTPKRETPGSS